jgi:crotonyl-CoA carboxylase/reductase
LETKNRTARSEKTLYELGETPPLGFVPESMYAAVIRAERFGEPANAIQIETVAVPAVGPHQVLVWIMAAGTNFNNVWAARGTPVDVIAARRNEAGATDFHIGGSDGAGIVWAVGEHVSNVVVGDEVVLGCGTRDQKHPHDPLDPNDSLREAARIWGYQTNYGSFAQFALVEHYQCHPRPQHLSWEASAAYMLTGASAYHMLYGWPPHTVQPGDPVLVWGACGGLGAMALQMVRNSGGIAVAVVSDMNKAERCRQLGAAGVIDRTRFNHWGRLPDLDDSAAHEAWLAQARSFGNAIYDIVGSRRSPRIVLEHPGEATVPTSIYVCDEFGMIVICGGTSGYNCDLDVRHLWMRQKRLQGSHFASVAECAATNALVMRKLLDPVLSRVFRFDEVGLSHQLMRDNLHPPGNMAILVNARAPGLSASPL